MTYLNSFYLFVCFLFAGDNNNISKDPYIAIVSFPKYCRFRSVLKRLEKCQDKWLKNALVSAIGGFSVSNGNTRILFCRETCDHPDLQEHDLRCDYLGKCAGWSVLVEHNFWNDDLFWVLTQCLSQDFETGCLKLAVVNFLGVQILKRDHNILIFQP